MKTVRFSNMVQKAGKPEVHLVFLAPAKDRELQAAIKANRVMTVQQSSVGNKPDRGEIGFHPGPRSQFLVFPKSLRAFTDSTVVGIKYELVASEEVPKTPRTAEEGSVKKKIRSAKAAVPSKPKPVPARRKREKKVPELPEPNVVPFQPATPEDHDVDEDVAGLREQVRRAVRMLKKGDTIAATDLLKRIANG